MLVKGFGAPGRSPDAPGSEDDDDDDGDDDDGDGDDDDDDDDDAPLTVRKTKFRVAKTRFYFQITTGAAPKNSATWKGVCVEFTTI